MEISKEEFLKKYNFESDVLEKNNIDWGTLEEIYIDYVNTKDELEEHSNFLAGLLRKQEKVHTVRTRIKDPEHLIAKLIRKTPERKTKYTDDGFQFTVQNYKEEITDLIGVRVIHIFKEDWYNLHKFISATWKVKEAQANVRDGDNQENYTNHGIKINSRKTGYRSVHYLIEFSPTIQTITAELQVRTIFEEGYGEIDHQLSYPNSNVPEVLTLNLLMLNRLAGSADEMASAVKTIKEEWGKMQRSLSEKDREIENLKTKINNLDIKQDEKDSLVKDLDRVKLIKFRDLTSAFTSNIDDYFNPIVINPASIAKMGDSVINTKSIAKIEDSVINPASTAKMGDSVINTKSIAKMEDSVINSARIAKLEDLNIKPVVINGELAAQQLKKDKENIN